MKISTWLKLLLCVFSVLFTGVFVCLYFLNQSFNYENIAVQRQIQFKQLGIELAGASDYLTNEARAYVQFGEPSHYTNYWREVNLSQTGIRVVAKLRELDAPEAELALIAEAKKNSDALVKTEVEAMKAVQDRNFDLARQLMFDSAYERNKQRIMEPIKQFQEIMNKRAEGEAAAAHANAMRMLNLTIFCLIATFLILLAILLLILHRFKPSSVNIMIKDLMATLQSVHQSKDQLEELVQRRTEELERKNVLLEEAKEAADTANRAKSQFIANVSHEIRTPMNAILGFNYLLQQSNLTNQQIGYVHNSILSAKNLLGIINDILDYSKIEADKLQIEHIDFDLYEVLGNISNIVSFNAFDKGLRLHFSVHHSVPQILNGDPFRLNQILLNLINNAIKFTHKGEISVAVSVQSDEEDAVKLRFDVRDTGIGLTEEQCRQLFRQFTQADMSTTRRYGGTGLGLVICKSLVELMGGTIDVSSKVGVGSDFFFTVQFRPGTEQLIQIDRSFDLKFLRVLLVCDNPEMQIVMQNQLEQFQFIVTAASTGLEAAIHCERNRYDLIVIDAMLQGAEVIRLAEQIKREHAVPSPPLVLLSAYHESKLQELPVSEAFQKVLYFPISQSQLFEEIVSLFKQQMSPKLKVSPIQEEAVPFTDLRNAEILLVEDNEINQMVATEILKEIGLRIDVANNGLEALEMFKSKKYDAVLMDLQMPLMDGYEAARRIKGLGSQPETPIIAMTADAMEDTRIKTLEAGMQGYVTKPFEAIELFSILQRMIQQSRQSSELLKAYGREAAE